VLEAKGLKVNTRETKVMLGCIMKGRMEKKGRWHCNVCKKGVGSNRRALGKNQICLPTMKLRKSLVKPVTRQNI